MLVHSNGVPTVTVLNQDTDFADNEVITVLDGQLGGGGGNLTFAVNGIESRKQYETLVYMSGAEGGHNG